MRRIKGVVVLVFLLSMIDRISGGSPHKWDKLLEYASYSFDDYRIDFQKQYRTETEFFFRKSIFERNLKDIIRYNRGVGMGAVGGYVKGVNHLTDLDASELPLGFDKHMHPSWRRGEGSDKELTHTSQLDQFVSLFEMEDPSLLPKSVDWRTKGVVTPVKSQGRCGSCWAFASVAALESHIAIETGNLFSFSPQELVSCTPNPNNCGGRGGCTGSTSEIAFDFVANKGIVDEWQFGYQSFSDKTVPCSLNSSSGFSFSVQEEEERASLFSFRGGNPTKHQARQTNEVSSSKNYYEGAVATIQGFSKLPSNNYTAMMNAIAKHGPLAVNVAATPWHDYEGGVFSDHGHSLHNTDINHVVVLVGYGTDEETNEDYWLVRNSWGPLWGEDGYIRLKRVNPSTLVNPDSDCGLDLQPADGIGCTKDNDGKDVKPPAVKVCGTSGILFDGVIPVGGRLI